MRRRMAPAVSSLPELTLFSPSSPASPSSCSWLAAAEEDYGPNTGSAPDLQSNCFGTVLPEIAGPSVGRPWDLDAITGASKEFAMLRSSHTASYSSFASDFSEPPVVLSNEMPRLPPQLRVRPTLRRPKQRMKKDDSRASVGSRRLRRDYSYSSVAGATSEGFHHRSHVSARKGVHPKLTSGGKTRQHQQSVAERTVEHFLQHRHGSDGDAMHFWDEESDNGSDIMESRVPSGVVSDIGRPRVHSGIVSDTGRPARAHFSGTSQITADPHTPSIGSPENVALESDDPQKIRRSIMPHPNTSHHRRNSFGVPGALSRIPVEAVLESGDGKQSGSSGEPQVDRPPLLVNFEGRERKKREEGSSSVFRMPLEERMKRIEERRGEQLKQTKSQKKYEQKINMFYALPATEQDALEQAFMRFDIDNSGFLDHGELVYCLREFGLAGTTAAEKREILNICCEAMVAESDSPKAQVTSEDVQISLVDLALIVVPRVRMAMTTLRGEELLKEFFKYDIDGSGKLSKSEMKELARGMGLDPRMMELPGALPPAIAKGHVAQRGREQAPVAEEEVEVDFETCKKMIIRGRERSQRICRDRERAVQKKAGLSEATFQDFREDLVSLYEMFTRYDKDKSNSLNMAELMSMFRECGMGAKCIAEKKDYAAIFRSVDKNHDKEFNFSEFLNLVRHIRSYRREKRREKLLERFVKYDRDQSGYLSPAEIAAMLSDLGFGPRNKKEQDELAYIIASVDVDGSGFIDFIEFLRLSQRIDEKLKIVRWEEEIEFAMCLGFTEKQMIELRGVFDSLDTDGGGSLDMQEVRNGMVLMRKESFMNMSVKAFEALFKQIDKDGTGALDFMEFLSFFNLMRNSDLHDKEDAHKLEKRASNLEIRVLRRVLEYFRLGQQYISSLSHEELVSLFCEYFTVTATTNLHEALEVKTVGGLYEAAQRRDLVMQSAGGGSDV